ncbi:hypothetical protein BT67DRAFT_451986 [Trichocladium antarcticum]|uniref:Mediator of RNA polymerase II transcription subunit 9 n=1 Tax=Trichocladium antarcticum TaxID=1450529 RepID=A0AAN6ZAW6_9PEZI|nr:hypothetical protein BT67DRAFT_451986 [Trichocladium antarcticum]
MATHLPDGLSPDAVDTLTELASIITKLRSAQQTSATAAAGTATAAATAGGGPATSSAPSAPTFGAPVSTPSAPGGVTGTTPLPISAATPGGGGSGSGSGAALLSAKELPSATDNLKHKLQRARAAMRTLADVRRTTAQQEAEMEALQGRRRLQAGMLTRTQEDGVRFVKAEELEEEGAGDRMVE